MMVNGQENKTEMANTQQKETNAPPNIDTNLKQVQPEANSGQNGAQNAGNSGNEQAQEDPNWKAFREARKKDRAEREAAERKAFDKEQEVAALKAAMEAAFAKGPIHGTPRPESNAYEYGVEESEDERIEKKVQAAIAQREAVAEKARIQREHEEYPTRLRETFSDIDQITAQENLDYLDYHYPEVARPLQSLPDGFDKWAHIYRAVKKFVPNSTTSKKEAARAEANFNKPKSMSSASVNQSQEMGTRVSQHDIEQHRAARYAEMKRIINRVG